MAEKSKKITNSEFSVSKAFKNKYCSAAIIVTLCPYQVGRGSVEIPIKKLQIIGTYNSGGGGVPKP